jgi:hypothetical protein
MRLINIIEDEQGFISFDVQATEQETEHLVNYAVCDMLDKEVIKLSEEHISLGVN